MCGRPPVLTTAHSLPFSFTIYLPPPIHPPPHPSHFSGPLYFSNLKSYLLISYVSPLRLGDFYGNRWYLSSFHCSYARATGRYRVRRSHSMTRIFPLFHSLSANHRSDLPSKGNCAIRSAAREIDIPDACHCASRTVPYSPLTTPFPNRLRSSDCCNRFVLDKLHRKHARGKL